MRRRFGLLAAMVLALAGCGGSSHPAPRKEATSATAAAPARAARPRCGDAAVTAHAIRFRTSDGVGLSGAVIGSGPVGAVLIHEYPRDLCGWWPYARYLSRHGVRALLFDLRCFGRSACPGGRGHAVDDVAAAVAELRRRGARTPALFAVARGDRYVSPADMRTLARRVRSRTRRVIVLPAIAGHGWDLLFGVGSDWSPLAATVAAFIRRHAGRPA